MIKHGLMKDVTRLIGANILPRISGLLTVLDLVRKIMLLCEIQKIMFITRLNLNTKLI